MSSHKFERRYQQHVNSHSAVSPVIAQGKHQSRSVRVLNQAQTEQRDARKRFVTIHPDVPEATEITGGIADFNLLRSQNASSVNDQSSQGVYGQKEFTLPEIKYRKGRKAKKTISVSPPPDSDDSVEQLKPLKPSQKRRPTLVLQNVGRVGVGSNLKQLIRAKNDENPNNIKKQSGEVPIKPHFRSSVDGKTTLQDVESNEDDEDSSDSQDDAKTEIRPSILISEENVDEAGSSMSPKNGKRKAKRRPKQLSAVDSAPLLISNKLK